jgi:hypothetical protein
MNNRGISIFSGNELFEMEVRVNDWLVDFSDEILALDVKLSTAVLNNEALFTIVVLYEELEQAE